MKYFFIKKTEICYLLFLVDMVQLYFSAMMAPLEEVWYCTVKFKGQKVIWIKLSTFYSAKI